MANLVTCLDWDHSDLPFLHDVDNMKPEDVGLSGELQFKTKKGAEGAPRVIYTTIYKGANFSVRLIIHTCVFKITSSFISLFVSKNMNLHEQARNSSPKDM